MTRPAENRKHAPRVYVMRPVRPAAAAVRLVREGTTGQIVECLPRVWAVASPRPPRCRGDKPSNRPVPVASSPVAAHAGSPEQDSPPPELAFYRKYTEALLRRYMRLSMVVGRVPSLIGREFFRGNVTHYRVQGFEDVVIFCHDVEKTAGADASNRQASDQACCAAAILSRRDSHDARDQPSPLHPSLFRSVGSANIHVPGSPLAGTFQMLSRGQITLPWCK